MLILAVLLGGGSVLAEIGKIDIKGDLKAGSFLLQPNQDASNDAMMKVGGTLSAGSYEFVLSNVKNGDVIVEAANSKLKGKDIEVSFTNQNFSDINDKVILFKGKNDLTAGSSLGSNYKTAKGVGNVNVKSKLSAIYTDQIYGLDSDGNFILGFKNNQATTNPQIVSILTPLIANLELSNRLNDQISNELTNLNGIFYDNNISSDDIVTFANLEGFISDYDDVDLKGYSAIAGVTQRDDDLVYGAFMEYGKGEFDGSLNKIEYDGDLYSVGLGILGKVYMKDNFYIDAYAKIGRFRDDFESTYINNFKLSNTYKGFGAAVGYYKNFENLSLDSKIGYAYSYASGKSIELEGKNGSKEVVNFGSLKSNRIKFDNRFLFGSIFRPYLNANIEYEFSGENGFHTIQLPNGESMNFDGFSAGAGLGFSYTPSKNLVINLEVNQIFGTIEETNARLVSEYKF
ncbi:autotransporter outer membrane beta-barrel domain-containing protein [Campylobacter sputorum]|uniref:autotransporter outer membrane beta-barrel domain-containing protein n=1 Tax=Campylobacter sputorum TaxID=206 RepID=UPI000B76C488|nr:autotransporter outer membrane beta-barrel domain-containing protein [Campylobacter sputorum]